MSMSEILYKELLGPRFQTFKMAIDEFISHGSIFIVETGCIRWVGDLAVNNPDRDKAIQEREKGNFMGDMTSGCSTLLFSMLSQDIGCQFDSIDFSEKSINAAKIELKQYSKFVTFHQSDSVQALKDWKLPIDLLYLDSMGSSAEPLIAQEHQLKEIKAAYPRLTKNAIVLLDDNQENGKTKLSKDFLINQGWEIKIDNIQCLLERGKI